MDPIRRFSKPNLRRPRAVVAFQGWNDACDAASGAVSYLLGQYDAQEPFAIVEPEEFFDFQARRPHVEIGDGGTRNLTWPLTRLYAVDVPGDTRDLVVVLGEEPNLRWKTFGRLLVQQLCELDVEEVVLLGAFIGQVPHTKPVPLIGVATDPRLVSDHGLATSDYEGPTGIIGVLQEACREVGMPAISVWAATPHYLAANPNPKAMLALMRTAGEILRLPVDPAELEKASAEYEARVAEAMRASGNFAEYVSELEHGPETAGSADLDPGLSAGLVDEIEDFLRDQG